jgi:beta,beta-carotene 9',10'-dioxygenase
MQSINNQHHKPLFDLGFGVTEQELQLPSLPVQGQIPAWLTGTLIRNGPGTFQVGKQRYRHWFDGLAMLHKFSFGQGQVSYANKYLDTRSYRAAREGNQIAYSEFATDPCWSVLGRAKAFFSPRITDSAKVNVARLAGRYMALAETPIQVEFDPQTLRSVGVFNYEERLVGQMTTVHPQIDTARDEIYNVVTRYHAISHYNLYRLRDGRRVERVASLPIQRPAYMHSFGMTENYLILAEFPLVVNPLHLLLWLKPYIENFHWQPRRGTPFWVVSRKTGELVGRYEAEAFFAFHHVNAFEQGDELVIDIDAYPDASIIQAYYLDNLKDPAARLPAGQLRRYRIPLRGQHADYETISEACMELPVFDVGRYNMRSDYRYVYAVGVSPQQPNGFYNQIIKVDIQERTDQAWYRPGCYPGEPVFVARPGGRAEDDGVLLSVVLDGERGTSFLLVLDAADLRELGRAEIPQAVLFGYHGAYFAEVEGRHV